MQVIALTGQARAGKTHIVHLLAKQAFAAGQVPVLVSFAGALKRASAEAGFPKETHPVEYREFCQTEGALRREANPDHWVDLTKEEILAIAHQEQAAIARGDKYWERVILIDDVRYENEIDAVATMDGILLHVYAGDRLPVPHARFRRHESERLGKRIDRTHNDIEKMTTIFYDRGDSECSVFWVDNSGSTKSVEAMMEKFGPYFLGTHIAQTESTNETESERKLREERAKYKKPKRGPNETIQPSDKEMQDFVDELNRIFDQLDDDDIEPTADDGWTEEDPYDPDNTDDA